MFFSKQQNKKDRPKTRNNENGSLVSFLNNNISKGRNARRDQRFTLLNKETTQETNPSVCNGFCYLGERIH